jgi:hypothetical protein
METKVKRAIRFYTSSEYDILRKEILSGRKFSKIVQEYAILWNRDSGSLRGTIENLNKKLKLPVTEQREVRFYTQNEIDTIKKETIAGVASNEIAIKYAVAWNRDFESLRYKARNIRRELNLSRKLQNPAKITPVQVKEVITTPVQEAKLTLPEGMTFEGVAKRVELHSNHFRVYF